MDMGNPPPTQRQRDRKNYYQERTSTDAFLLGWALEESTSTSVLAYCNGLKANWVVNLVAAPSPKTAFVFLLQPSDARTILRPRVQALAT